MNPSDATDLGVTLARLGRIVFTMGDLRDPKSYKTEDLEEASRVLERLVKDEDAMVRRNAATVLGYLRLLLARRG